MNMKMPVKKQMEIMPLGIVSGLVELINHAR